MTRVWQRICKLQKRMKTGLYELHVPHCIVFANTLLTTVNIHKNNHAHQQVAFECMLGEMPYCLVQLKILLSSTARFLKGIRTSMIMRLRAMPPNSSGRFKSLFSELSHQESTLPPFRLPHGPTFIVDPLAPLWASTVIAIFTTIPSPPLPLTSEISSTGQ